jgi:predicted nucleic acid-binding protein
LVTTNFIIGETHALVLRRMGRRTALRFLNEIDGSATRLERVTPEDELRARLILARYDDKDFSYVDATCFAVMERLGIRDAFALDRNFAQYGFAIIG